VKETFCCSVDNVILAFMISLVQYSSGVPSAGCRTREEEQHNFRVRGEERVWDGVIRKQSCNSGKVVHLAVKKTRDWAAYYLSSLARIIIFIYK